MSKKNSERVRDQGRQRRRRAKEEEEEEEEEEKEREELRILSLDFSPPLPRDPLSCFEYVTSSSFSHLPSSSHPPITNTKYTDKNSVSNQYTQNIHKIPS